MRKRFAIALKERPRSLAFPDSSDSASAGVTTVAPSIRFCTRAAETAELGISMKWTLFESPPPASIQAWVASEMRSLSDDAETVLPLRSDALAIGESFATTK